MSEPRIDKATGAEMLPPSRFRPYWHAAPEPAKPLAAHGRDDPYDLDTQPPQPTTTGG